MDNNIPIYKYANHTGTYLRPPEHLEPITADGFEISPGFIKFDEQEPYSGDREENPYPHLREFMQICGCNTQNLNNRI